MRWYPRVLVAALGAALLIGVLFGSGASTVSGRLGGDYAAFYGAGRIVVEHDWEHLYQANRQLEAQQDLYPGEESEQYLSFAYPPFVAGAYAPLALLPYRASYLIHVLLMTAAVAVSIWIAGDKIPILRRNRVLSFALALFFYPMLRSIAGGQNTALTLFLLVASWRLAMDRNDFAAGLVLSLLLFKPQYAVPMMMLYALTGRWKVLTGGVLGAGTLYLAGAAVMGMNWVIPWWIHAQEFGALDAAVNGVNSISFIGFVTNVLDSTVLVVLLGLLPALAVVAGLAFYWLRGRPNALTEKMALAAAGIILISPHTMYYDGSLILITIGVLAAGSSLNPRSIALVWVLALTQVLADFLGWSPFFFVVVGIAAWAVRSLGPGLLGRGSPSLATD